VNIVLFVNQPKPLSDTIPDISSAGTAQPGRFMGYRFFQLPGAQREGVAGVLSNELRRTVSPFS